MLNISFTIYNASYKKPRRDVMKNTIIAILLLIVTNTSDAIKTINKITNDSFSGSKNQVILKGQLFFLSLDGYIWTSAGTSESTKPLLYNGAKIKSRPQNLLKYKDQIIFVNLSDNLTLWKTDGIVFEKLSNVPISFFRGIHLQGNTVAGMSEGKIILLDEQTVSEVDISSLTSPRIESLCRLPGEEFAILARDSELNYSKLYHYTSGEFVEIATDLINAEATKEPRLALQHNGSCFYSFQDSTNTPKYLQLTENVDIAMIESIDGTNTWKKIFVFNDEVYFVRHKLVFDNVTNEFDGRQVFQLNGDSNMPVRLDNLNLPGVMTFVVSSDNYLYFTTEYVPQRGMPGPSPMPPPILVIYDGLLNQITNDSTYFIGSLAVISAGNNDIILRNRDIDEINFLEQDVMGSKLQLANTSVDKILSDDLATFVIGRDRNNNNKSSIYIISDQALISEQLTGVWASPDWDNQGMVLNTGKREDGSVYVFISFFLYKDGLPFWLSGNIDYALGSSSVTMELFEFTGSSFLPNEEDIPIERISYGEITLSPRDCNQLDILININDGDSVDLSLQRIINTRYANLCVPSLNQ